MKRLLLSILAAVVAVVATHGARALNEPAVVSQPDGTLLTITLHGDEHAAWTTTADGVIVVSKDHAYYVADIADDGTLCSTGLLAHEATGRSSHEQQACLRQAERRQLFFDRCTTAVEAARRAQVTNTGYLPHKDSPRCLVILANFSDVAFSYASPKAQFEQYFNGDTQEDLGQNEQKNLVSVRKYFEHSSGGLFTPQFDIVGPITLPQTVDYYGRNTGGDATDANYFQFCKDALDAVDDDVDFRNYDNNGDGRAELVCIVYAGYGENVAGNPSNTLWPKCSSINLSTADGITINYMNCSPELYRTSRGTDINGIGLFCHEFSHGMGLPDLYPTEVKARINNQTPEFWDLMDYGEYGNSGYAPVPYTAWEREAMGWIEIEQLTDTQTAIELKPLVKGGKAYKFGNGANSEEWFIVENVQPRDNTNKVPGFSYGHGLLVWHIAYARSTVSMGDYPNNTPGAPRVSVVPADGLIINGYNFGSGKPYTQDEYIASLGGDPFPGTSSVTTLSAAQELPNYTFYNGDATPAFQLKNIAEAEDGTVTFDFDNGTTTIVELNSRHAAAGDALYTLDGRRIATAGNTLPRGIYIRNGKKIVR